MKTVLLISLLCLFLLGCEKSEPVDRNNLSSNESYSNVLIFFALVALAVFAFLLYVWEREKREDSISKVQEQLKKLTSQIERQQKNIIQQANLITDLRCSQSGSTSKKHESDSEPWQKIKKGMTEDEVNNILGHPMAIFPTANGEMNHYGQSDMEGQIFFEDGKVAYYAKPKIDKKLTDIEVFRHLYQESLPTKKQDDSSKNCIQTADPEVEIWDTIEKGMTQEEIIKKVGKPHRVEPLADNGELWWFGSPYSNRQIRFQHGKLVGFEKNIRGKQEWDAT